MPCCRTADTTGVASWPRRRPRGGAPHMASAQASPETPICPTCQAPLALGANGLTGFWSCPNGHGAACTVTAAYGHVQDDEIRAIWQSSAQAQPGSRACPMCGHPMVEVSVDAAAAAGAQ